MSSYSLQVNGKTPTIEEVRIIALALAVDVWKTEYFHNDDFSNVGSSVRGAHITALAVKFEKFICAS